MNTHEVKFIVSKMKEIKNEYDALSEKPRPVPASLIRYLALADTVEAWDDAIEEELDRETKSVLDVMPITLADVDRMALETLTMTGKITIREDTPPSPSVGWPGSDTKDGKITGRFEIPEEVVPFKPGPSYPLYIIVEGTEILLEDIIGDGYLWDKIGEYDGIINQVDKKITTDIEITGVTKKGGRAVVEFKVVVK